MFAVISGDYKASPRVPGYLFRFWRDDAAPPILPAAVTHVMFEKLCNVQKDAAPEVPTVLPSEVAESYRPMAAVLMLILLITT
jgi:hypothetical protein